MATRDNWCNDRFDSVLDGMNEAVEADSLLPTQFARGVNIITRKGVAQTRFGFDDWVLTDPASHTGTWQGGFRYQLNSAEMITWVMSGRIYVLNLTAGILTDISTAFGVSLGVAGRCYFCKAEKFLVIQDGVNPPVYLDGITAAAQMPGPNQVPIGTIMAYGHSRLFVVPAKEPLTGQDGRRFILAGDVYQPNVPMSVLTFTEPYYYASGGAIALPEEQGFIGGIAFIRNATVNDGYGPMVVLARRGGTAFAVNEPRETLYDMSVVPPTVVREGWADHDISQKLFSNVGCASPFSLLLVNADLLFRGNKDGMRSLSVTANEVTTTLRNTSLSGEMQDVFRSGNDTMLSEVTSAFSDNRVLFTALPDAGGTYFRGVASLDMNVVNNVKNRLPPSFDGTFTGPRVLQILTAEYDGRDRLFAFVKTDTGIRLVYESDDATTDVGEHPIQCRMYTRKMHCGKPDTLKQLDSLRLWLADVRGTVAMQAYVRTDDYPYWTQLDKSVTFEAPATGQPQQRRNVVFAANNINDDPVEGGNGRRGFLFQFAIFWQGHCRIKRGRMRAEFMPEPSDAASIAAQEGVSLTQGDWLDIEATDYDATW